MEIYLLRHGIAEDPKPGSPDASRALTPEGKKKLREVLQLAGSGGLSPAVILTSPLRRALETAEIAAKELGCKNPPIQTKALSPSGGSEQIWQEIRNHRNAAQVLLSGHEPLLSITAAYLLGSLSLALDFKKGAIVRIDVEQPGPIPRGVLKWMLTPRLAQGKRRPKPQSRTGAHPRPA